MSTHTNLFRLYQETFGKEPEQIDILRADGSNRELYRLSGPDDFSCIGVHGPDAAENRAFVAFSRALRNVSLPVPKIYGLNEECHIYLEEDLGNQTLYDALRKKRIGDEFPEALMAPYRTVAGLLPRFQVTGGEVIDFSLSIPRAEFDRRSMIWDLHYFKYMFLKLTGTAFDEERLRMILND